MTFSFFSFLLAVCKDSWEDLTDVVEQLRDDTEGACHAKVFQLLFPLMIGFCLVILSRSAAYSLPVPMAGAFWTCLSGWTRFPARTCCTSCTLCGWLVSAVRVLNKMPLIAQVYALLLKLFQFTFKMDIVKAFLIFISPFMGSMWSILTSKFLPISLLKICAYTIA